MAVVAVGWFVLAELASSWFCVGHVGR